MRSQNVELISAKSVPVRLPAQSEFLPICHTSCVYAAHRRDWLYLPDSEERA